MIARPPKTRSLVCIRAYFLAGLDYSRSAIVLESAGRQEKRMNLRGQHPVSIRTISKIFATLVLGVSLFTPLGARLTGAIHVQAAPLQTQALDPDCFPPHKIFLPIITQQTGSVIPQTGVMQSEETFVDSVVNGEADTLRGVYVPDILALPVEQQPKNDSNYIRMEPDLATQYRPAARFGVTGLLAHNTLAGKLFFDMKIGDVVTLAYGDGSTQRYQVTQIARFQARNANHEYVDLEDGEIVSGAELFQEMYTGTNHVTFQTCIFAEGNESWGRLFVVATPIGE
jgi:hypothetical protein